VIATKSIGLEFQPNIVPNPEGNALQLHHRYAQFNR
jgi:hypothetical protein